MKVLHLTDTHKGLTSRTGKIHEKWIRQLEKLDFDVVVHTGDHASSKLDEVRRSFKYLRRLAGDRHVLAVMGNHDFWNDPKVMPWTALERHNEWADQYDIKLLYRNAVDYLKDGIAYRFVGWNGWYATPPISNDFNWIPAELPDGGGRMHHWFKATEAAQLNDALFDLQESNADVNVVCTHFPIHPELPDRARRHPMAASGTHFDLIARTGAHVLLYGHTHRTFEAVIDGVYCHNPGSDYDKPVGVVVDLCAVSSKWAMTNMKVSLSPFATDA